MTGKEKEKAARNEQLPLPFKAKGTVGDKGMMRQTRKRAGRPEPPEDQESEDESLPF